MGQLLSAVYFASQGAAAHDKHARYTTHGAMTTAVKDD